MGRRPRHGAATARRPSLDREIRIDRPAASRRAGSPAPAPGCERGRQRADAFFGQPRTASTCCWWPRRSRSCAPQQEKARIAALQAMMAEEDRIDGLRESLSAALFQIEGPLNMMTSVVGMLERRGRQRPDGGRPGRGAAGRPGGTRDAARADSRAQRRSRPPVNLNELLRDVLDLDHGRAARRRHHGELAAAGRCCRRCRAIRTSCARCSRR